MVVKLKNGTMYHEQHFLMTMEMKEEIRKAIADFKKFKYGRGYKKVDSLSTSELIRFLLDGFLQEYNTNPNAKLNLLKEITDYRIAGAKE